MCHDTELVRLHEFRSDYQPRQPFLYCSYKLAVIFLSAYSYKDHSSNLKMLYCNISLHAHLSKGHDTSTNSTQLLSWVGRIGVCVIGLQLDFFHLSSLIPDRLVGSRPPYDSTVELGWLMCHGL